MNFREYHELYEAVENGSEQYNQVIIKHLGTDSVPTPFGNYKLGVDFTVDKKDFNIFKLLFPVTPPKKGETVQSYTAGTKASGNGEIALYWLLSKNYTVSDTRGKDHPDLTVDGHGVEVKSFKPGASLIPLGRFESQGENLKLLSIIFGIQVLLGTASETTLKKRKQGPPSLMSFRENELVDAFNTIKEFISNKQLRSLAPQFVPIQTLYQQIDSTITALGLSPNKFTAEEGAAAVLKLFLVTKLATKPRFGGYIVNITADGHAEFYYVDEKAIKNMDTGTILSNVFASNAALYINMNIFTQGTGSAAQG